MAFQTVPNGVKIEVNALQNGIPIVNVHYVTLTDDPEDEDLFNIGEAMATWYDDFGRNLHHTSYVLQSIVMTDVSVESGHQYSLTAFDNPEGTVTGAATAANGAAVISWRCANTGRNFRGRTYIGGLSNANLTTAQTLDSTMVDALVAAAEELIDALEAVGATLVVVSRFAAGVARVTALASEIISIIVDNKVDSQRRRTAN